MDRIKVVFFRFLGIALIGIFSSPNLVNADDKYCGIYSVFAAAQFLGVEIDFESLVSNKYVSGQHGSTARDLIVACEEHGLQASWLTGLTTDDLQAIKGPIIVNVFSDGQLNAPNHWMVFLSRNKTGVELANGSEGVVTLSLPDFLLAWRGNGIVVQKAGQQRIIKDPRPRRFFWFLLVLGFIGICLRVLSRFGSFASWAWQLILIGAATLLLALIQHKGNQAGYWNQPNNLNYIAGILDPESVNSISFEEFLGGTADERYIIDSRYEFDASQGMLPKAIGIPVDLSDFKIMKIVAAMDRNRPVVVYCHSTGCEFDHRIAVRLKKMGFVNVSKLEVGWMEIDRKQ